MLDAGGGLDDGTAAAAACGWVALLRPNGNIVGNLSYAADVLRARDVVAEISDK